MAETAMRRAQEAAMISAMTAILIAFVLFPPIYKT